MAYKNIHQKLIDKCIKGDKRAQFKIYEYYYKAMYNTSYRIIGDEMEAEDVMQDAFLSAFNNINTYKGEVSFGAWLKKIVVNRSLDALRKQKVDWVDEEMMPEFADDNENEELENIDVQVEQIMDGINKLPEGYRVVLSLYLLEGYDHDEIGEIMNITSSTSRSQFVRARKKLLEMLAN